MNFRMNSGKEPHELEKKEEEGLKKASLNCLLSFSFQLFELPNQSKSCSDLRHSGKPKECKQCVETLQ